jgi:hypothetical protein
MKNALLLTSAVLVTFGLPQLARGERPFQDRVKSDVTLRGRVTAVEEEWDLQHDYYRVRISVESVERGEGVRPGDELTVSCFRWSRPAPFLAGARGHLSIPETGDRVQVFANRRSDDYRRTYYEGVYPDWYDLLEPSPIWLPVRLWGHRKVRYGCLAAAAGAGCAWLIVRAQRARRKSLASAGEAAGSPAGANHAT